MRGVVPRPGSGLTGMPFVHLRLTSAHPTSRRRRRESRLRGASPRTADHGRSWRRRASMSRQVFSPIANRPIVLPTSRPRAQLDAEAGWDGSAEGHRRVVLSCLQHLAYAAVSVKTQAGLRRRFRGDRGKSAAYMCGFCRLSDSDAGLTAGGRSAARRRGCDSRAKCPLQTRRGSAGAVGHPEVKRTTLSCFSATGYVPGSGPVPPGFSDAIFFDLPGDNLRTIVWLRPACGCIMLRRRLHCLSEQRITKRGGSTRAILRGGTALGDARIGRRGEIL